MKTAYEKYLIHLNIKYDEKELFKEVDKLTFKEFAPAHCYFRSTWLKAALKKTLTCFLTSIVSTKISLAVLLEHTGKKLIQAYICILTQQRYAP